MALDLSSTSHLLNLIKMGRHILYVLAFCFFFLIIHFYCIYKTLVHDRLKI